MIYTLTANPSLDYIVDVSDFKIGSVNRTTHETIFPGGKGINVSIVLQNLGIQNKALGFTAGFTGSEIESQLQKKGVATDFIRVKTGLSRINVKLRAGKETEINGIGPEIQKEDVEELFEDAVWHNKGGYVENYTDRQLLVRLIKLVQIQHREIEQLKQAAS